MDPILKLEVEKLLDDPQAFNAYAYSRNNPILYVDPNGEFFIPAIAMVFGAAIIAATTAQPVNAPSPSSDIVPARSNTSIGAEIAIKATAYVTGTKAIQAGVNAVSNGYENISSNSLQESPNDNTFTRPESSAVFNSDGSVQSHINDWVQSGDPTISPGEGWEWKGTGDPTTGKGNYYYKDTSESLNPDFFHADPKGGHGGYAGSGQKVDIFPDGTVKPN